MEKVNVNKSTCIGCGACAQIDPEHFEIDDDGLSSVINNTPDQNTEQAVDSCPVSAISVVCEDGCENEQCHCEHCECENCNCGEEE